MIELKKGDKCIVKVFTGMKVGVFEVVAASKKTVTVMKKNGDELIFDKKTCRQVNVEEGKERFANSIMEDDGSYTAPNRGTKAAPAKKTSKKPTPAPVEEEEDEEEAPAPAKKSKKAAPTKKSKKASVVVDDEEDDDDDFEEIDD